MDQINAGILKLMNIPGSAHVNGNMADFGAKREPVFDVLLEQKSNQARTEVVSDKGRKPEDTEKIPTKETETEKKAPSTEETEEETCDVAREAAAAQIVWVMAPNAADLRVTAQQENTASIEQPLIIGINDEPGAVLGEEALAQIADKLPEIEGLPKVETAPVVEAEVMPEQTVETVPEEAQPQLETSVDEQPAEDAVVEIRVTENDSDETGAEAAVTEAPLFEEVETAPIKVAEAPERAEKAPEVEKQVSEKLVSVLESGETRVEIRLDPAELGKLTIELTRNEDGALNILLNAENVQTRGLLERHVTGLQEALAERGQQNVQITVDQSNESQRQDNNANQRNDFQDGSNGRQNEQHRRDDHRSGEDFLQQLRLGLIPIEEEDDEET